MFATTPVVLTPTGSRTSFSNMILLNESDASKKQKTNMNDKTNMNNNKNHTH